jgi:hypothetical protein
MTVRPMPELRCANMRTIDLESTSESLRDLRGRELAAVRRAITAAAREQRIVPRTFQHQVAVYAPRGEAELVFVWKARGGAGAELARLTRAASWRDSLEPHS